MSFNTKSLRIMFLRGTVVSLAIFGLLFAYGVTNTQAQAITEGFDDVSTLPASGWGQVNRSSPLGVATWSQCGGTAIPPAQAGAANSCILVNYQSTGDLGTISNWLFAPTVTLKNGDTFSFYTRTVSNSFPDRLQIRLSTNGASTEVGSTATSVGDFTTLLLDIDSDYSGTYPTTWTQFTVTVSGLSGPTSGRLAFRYFVENGGTNGTNSNIIGVDTFVYTPAPALTPGDAPVDLDGDGKTDYVVARNTGGGANGQLTWFSNINGSTAPTNGLTWGLASDVLVPADYDGDGKDDIAVWRADAAMSAAFYILQSQTNTVRVEFFGQTGDDPTVVADYNNDGKDDVAVYRPGAQSVWYYRTTPNGPVTFVPWGQTGDKPAPGDFNGDGTADFGIARNDGGSLRYWRWLSTGAVDSSIVFGLATDTIITGDFDGDGKTDVATVRSEGGLLTWYWKPSSGGADKAVRFGSAGDVLVPGDYDGDAKADPAVFRNGVFYNLRSSSASLGIFALGASGDRAPASYNTH
jgi:hypothetical protein